MLLAWTIIVLLILFTGLYVAAEFAAVGARRSRLRRPGGGRQRARRPAAAGPRRPARARSLHRRVAGRHHALEPDPRRLRPGDARAAGRAALRTRRPGCSPRRPRPRPAAVVLVFLTMLSVILGELVPKIARAAAPDHGRRSSPCCRCSGRCGVYAWSIVAARTAAACCCCKLLRVPSTGAPPRALARGDRAAHRGEPRRRPARAAGAGAAASRAPARPARRAAADGAARAAGGDRCVDAVRATCCASSPRARTAGCRSIAARSTTSSASCTPRTS